jgi:hypothetical protein
MAKQLTGREKLNLMEHTSAKQKALLGLLCCEAVAHLPFTKQAILCKNLLFEYVNGNEEVNDALDKATKHCNRGITDSSLEDTACVVNAAACSNLWAIEATAMAIAFTKYEKSCFSGWKTEFVEAYEKLFLRDGPMDTLVPDFENIPSLETMLLNYPAAVESARALFNANYKPNESSDTGSQKFPERQAKQ